MSKNKKKHLNDQDMRQEIYRLLDMVDVPNKKNVQSMVMTLIKMARETPRSSTNLKLISKTLRELRQAFKLFSRYRDARKVCIFGSARTPETDPEYIMAEDVARKITEKGFLLITGAGGGIMEAGNKGAIKSKNFGVNIELPFEQEANQYIVNDPKLITFQYFFTRKLTFVRETDATILFPGGFGTHDEFFEILTLVQTGHCAPRPIILMSRPESQYWEEWVSFLTTHLLEEKYISPEDLKLYKICKNTDEAVNEILEFFSYFHSVRYMGDMAHLRLSKPLSKQEISRLNHDFKDIITSGKIVQHMDCMNTQDHHFPHLPRLTFHFNKFGYGRLVELIYSLRD